MICLVDASLAARACFGARSARAHTFTLTLGSALMAAGVFQISWKKANKDKMQSKYIIVMPNLFYDRNVSPSVMNRFGSAGLCCSCEP
jgi:hypothetical protein